MQESTGQRLDLPFLAVLGLFLVAATAVAGAATWNGTPSQYLLQVAVWVATLAIVAVDRSPMRSGEASPPFLGRPRNGRTVRLALGLVVLFATASHYHLGRFHGGGRILHHHEFFNYYVGSKYFDELGYDGLYRALYQGLHENNPKAVERVELVRNLRTYELEGAKIDPQRPEPIAVKRSPSVVSQFSAERWNEFKGDVRYFQSKIPAHSWPPVLVDHGFNATPFWMLLGGSLAGMLDLGDGTLALLAALDPLLIVFMLGLIWRTFGGTTALLFAVFFFANPLATFDMTGASFLRQVWLAALVAFVCFFKKKAMVAAGIALAISILDRAFPVFFALVPATLWLAQTWRRRSIRHRYTTFFVSLGVALVVLAGLSAVKAGSVGAWRDFNENIQHHSGGFYTNQVSLRSLFVVNPASAASATLESWDDPAWFQERQGLEAGTRHSLLVVRALLLALLLALLARQKNVLASLSLVAFIPFVALYPADYYYSLMGVVLLARRRTQRRLAMTMAALLAGLWLPSIVFSSRAQVEFVHWLYSLALGVTLVIGLGMGLLRHARADRVFARFTRVLLAAGALGAGVAIALDAGFVNAGDHAELDLTRGNVVASDGVSKLLRERMASWGSAWSRNEHLVFKAEGPGASTTVRVPAPRQGTYDIKVVYSKTPVYARVGLEVGEKSHAAVNLFSPRVGILPVVYRAVPLVRGDNDLRFVVRGKDRASRYHFFAIDRIVLSAQTAAHEGAEAWRRALDRAIERVEDDPADAFDGNLEGVCREIVLFSQLAANPALAAAKDRYVEAVRRRVGTIDSYPRYRVQRSEWEILAAAAHAAGRVGCELQAFAAVAGELRAFALATDRDPRGQQHSFFLCRYLDRTDREQRSACGVSRSILAVEHARRQILQLISAPIDRGRAPEIRRLLEATTRDAFALSDFGLEALPGTGPLADQPFWSQLCEHGMRWAKETGDVPTVARLALFARIMGGAAAERSMSDALDWLVMHQERDGSLGAVEPADPDPRRRALVAAALAWAAGLRAAGGS